MSVGMLHRPTVHVPNLTQLDRNMFLIRSQLITRPCVFPSSRAVQDKSARTSRQDELSWARAAFLHGEHEPSCLKTLTVELIASNVRGSKVPVLIQGKETWAGFDNSTQTLPCLDHIHPTKLAVESCLLPAAGTVKWPCDEKDEAPVLTRRFHASYRKLRAGPERCHDDVSPTAACMSVPTYLTLLKTMSTSVRVMLLPSITPQSLQSLDQFLPCISLPVARVSPWMAKRRKASSRAVSSTGVEEPIPPSLVPLESDESLLDVRSLDWSVCGRKGTGLMLGCLAIWTRKSSALSLEKKKRQKKVLHPVMFPPTV